MELRFKPWSPKPGAVVRRKPSPLCMEIGCSGSPPLGLWSPRSIGPTSHTTFHGKALIARPLLDRSSFQLFLYYNPCKCLLQIRKMLPQQDRPTRSVGTSLYQHHPLDLFLVLLGIRSLGQLAQLTGVLPDNLVWALPSAMEQSPIFSGVGWCIQHVSNKCKHTIQILNLGKIDLVQEVISTADYKFFWAVNIGRCCDFIN